MNRVYGTDGNVYTTSISNGKEYTSSKNEKEDFAIKKLKQIEKRFEEEIERSANTNRYRDGIAFCKAVIHNTITELKGENK